MNDDDGTNMTGFDHGPLWHAQQAEWRLMLDGANTQDVLAAIAHAMIAQVQLQAADRSPQE